MCRGDSPFCGRGQLVQQRRAAGEMHCWFAGSVNKQLQRFFLSLIDNTAVSLTAVSVTNTDL